MKLETRKAIIGFSLGAILFVAVVHFFMKKDDKKDAVPVSDENISIALDAFKTAIEENETDEGLTELNSALSKSYNVTVEYDSQTGKYAVKDLSGNILKTI